MFYSMADALEAFDAAARAADPAREPDSSFWKATDANFLGTLTAGITQHRPAGLLVQLVHVKFAAAANVNNTLPLAVLAPRSTQAGPFKQTLSVVVTCQPL